MPRLSSANGAVSLTITLAASISALVFIAVASVLGLGLWTGSQNTASLLRDKAAIMIETTVNRIRTHLAASQNQVEFIERLIAQNRTSPADRPHFIATLTGALAAAPQVSALSFVDTNYQSIVNIRTADGYRTEFRDDRANAGLRRSVDEALANKQATWAAPVWLPEPKVTIFNLRMPVRHDGKPLGVLVASVTMSKLSEYLGNIEVGGASNVFVLYDRQNVLAHPNLASGAVSRSKVKPLPTLAETGDPVLAAIWNDKNRYPLLISSTDAEFKGHVLDIFGDRYAYFYRNVSGYGDKELQIGTYFRTADVNSEMQRLKWAGLAGLAALVLALITAIALARWISKPIVELAGAASSIGKLEISETPELQGSIFRELNDQAHSFNTMLQGLRWFETYVPKQLVSRLIKSSKDGLPASVERELTVMFTDIVGFTSLSESTSAPKLAEFLNEHFALLATCIEDQGGTVDKFIGDSVMAFWGAPDEQPDHAERAIKAASAITAAMESENNRRIASGAQPVQLRIGIHSGPVTVGNIGAPGRINYTIIGDAVNIGQRLEQLGKQFKDSDAPDTAVIVLASKDTVARLQSPAALESLGHHQLRGRDQSIEVFRLLAPAQP